MSTKKKLNLPQEFLTSSPEETYLLAKKFVRHFLAKREASAKKRGATLICLEGELGSGKTVFVQGLADGLGVKERILSPTFVIFKKFKLAGLKGTKKEKKGLVKWENFYHFDCYRINEPAELLALGFENIIVFPGNIVCLEWPQKIKKILSGEVFWLKFEIVGKNKRKIFFSKKFF